MKPPPPRIGRKIKYHLSEFEPIIAAAIPDAASAKSFRDLWRAVFPVKPISSSVLWRMIAELRAAGRLDRNERGYHIIASTQAAQ